MAVNEPLRLPDYRGQTRGTAITYDPSPNTGIRRAAVPGWMQRSGSQTPATQPVLLPPVGNTETMQVNVPLLLPPAPQELLADYENSDDELGTAESAHEWHTQETTGSSMTSSGGRPWLSSNTRETSRGTTGTSETSFVPTYTQSPYQVDPIASMQSGTTVFTSPSMSQSMTGDSRMDRSYSALTDSTKYSRLEDEEDDSYVD